MARIRSIKPEFWSDEKIVELDYEWRLLFQGIWNFADDQGFIDYSPKRIKMQVFPGDSIDVSRGLQILLEASLLTAYQLASDPDRRLLHVTNWERHQRVSNPAKPRFQGSDLRELREPPEPSGVVVIPLEDSRVLGKGREGKGEKTSSPAPRATREDPAFAEFWDAYPRKVGKGEARKAWAKVIKSGVDPASVIAGATRYRDDPDRQRKDIEFTKHPGPWLNAERWTDQPSAAVNGAPRGWWDN